MQTVPGKRIALLSVSLLLSACGGGGGGGGTVPSGTPIPTFTKWSAVQPGTVQLDGMGQQVSGTSGPNGFTNVSLTSPASEGYSAILTFDQSLELTGLAMALKSSLPATLVSFAGATFPDLTLAPGTSPQFVGGGSPGGNAAILAKPIELGWEYQTFGVWEAASTDGTGKTFGAMSVGNDAGTAIQGTGTATFTGYAAGTYVNAAGTGSTALAELTVDANFTSRSLGFSTINTRTSTDWVVFTQNDGLNLTGTLFYDAGTNSFTGTVTSAGLTGNSTGQFYGPNAEELGGVFFLKGSGVETYAGAYGAAKQ